MIWKKIFIAILVIGLGCSAGWFIKPHWLWEQKIGYDGPPSSDDWHLAYALERASCGGSGLLEDWNWSQHKTFPKMRREGKIVSDGQDRYKLPGNPVIKIFGSDAIAVSAFGLRETPEFVEMYYLTPMSFHDIATLYKVPGKNSTTVNRIVAQTISPHGLLVQRTLHIDSTEEGTRVSCREWMEPAI